MQFTARQYRQFERRQKLEPVPICSYRGKTWWWYLLEFFTAPENCDDHKVAQAIRARFHSHQTDGHTHPVVNEAFHARVLGLRGRVTFDDIRRHYRQRMLEYHPDKVASLGPKLREVAEEETKRINAAYEFFEGKYSK